MAAVSIIIPCHNEEAWISACISSIFKDICDQNCDESFEVLVIANGCTDATISRARSHESFANRHGIMFAILETGVAEKSNALNIGDVAATGDIRIYIDADVRIAPGLLAAVVSALRVDNPRYVTGTISIPQPRSYFSKCYARVWLGLPFVVDGAPGCGLYAVNAAGRSRWKRFPHIHSDDRFVRSHFRSSERESVGPHYFWPIPEGLVNLVMVRRRWCEGNGEFVRQFPSLVQNTARRCSISDFLKIALRSPKSAMIFALVFVVSFVLSKFGSSKSSVVWRRGRL